MFKKNLSLAFERFFPLVLSGPKELIFLYLLAYPVSLFFNIQLEGFRVPTPDMEMSRIIVLFSQALFEYFFAIIRTMFVITLLLRLLRPKVFSNKSVFNILKANFLQVLIERLRCVYAIAWRSILLIIPGFYEYARLLFVDHMVLLNKNYHQGEVDALDASRDLTKGHRLALFGGWLLFIFLLISYNVLALNLIPAGFFQHLMVYTGSFVVEVLLATYMASYFLNLFDKDSLKIQE